MNDARVWEFEESLWTGSAEHYRESIDTECVMVLPHPPYVLAAEEAIKAVTDTPRWTKVELSHREVKRPQEGLIAVAYKVEAFRNDEKGYEAYCTSTYRWLEHEVWRVVQHQQTPPVAMKA